jgi:hypothetical protein
MLTFLAHRFLSPWWWRHYDPPKHQFSQEPHGVTSQKAEFFIVTENLKSYISIQFILHSTLNHYLFPFALNTMIHVWSEETSQFSINCSNLANVSWRRNYSLFSSFHTQSSNHDEVLTGLAFIWSLKIVIITTAILTNLLHALNLPISFLSVFQILLFTFYSNMSIAMHVSPT